MVPASRVLGCCSRLGTWSAACRRAGLLRLPSKTCRTVLQASCWPPALGTRRGHGAVLALLPGTPQPCPRCPEESCGTGVGMEMALQGSLQEPFPLQKGRNVQDIQPASVQQWREEE